MMADGNNNRVLLWDELPSSNTEPHCLTGDFGTNNSGESKTGLKWWLTAAGGGKYVIADTYNHRIMIWANSTI